jgi:hypothetical protein
MSFLCILVFWVLFVNAAPYTNDSYLSLIDTSPSNLQESDSSNTRTLCSLIWSCLTIIFTCTWAAVHPNIPDLNDTIWTMRMRKMKMCLIALVAPEWMVMWAVRQSLHAKQLRNFYNKSHENSGRDIGKK